MTTRITYAADAARTPCLERSSPDEDADCACRCLRCGEVCQTREEELAECCEGCQEIITQEENE